MKSIVILLLSVVFVSSCSEDENTPTAPINDTFDPTGATLIKDGMFVGAGGYAVSGTATLYEKDGKKYLVLDPFSSSNGPDLRVYLSTDANASSFLNLGLLKSVTGKQSYVIPGNPNLANYTYVHIWCQEFSVQFGRAEVK